jgi:hypothetical protein
MKELSARSGSGINVGLPVRPSQGEAIGVYSRIFDTRHDVLSLAIPGGVLLYAPFSSDGIPSKAVQSETTL